MNATHPRKAAVAARKAAVAAYEALPAILLAAALLMPALAAFAARNTGQAAPERVELSQAIAAQGNQALVEIRQESRESLRATPDPAVAVGAAPWARPASPPTPRGRGPLLQSRPWEISCSSSTG